MIWVAAWLLVWLSLPPVIDAACRLHDREDLGRPLVLLPLWFALLLLGLKVSGWIPVLAFVLALVAIFGARAGDDDQIDRDDY